MIPYSKCFKYRFKKTGFYDKNLDNRLFLKVYSACQKNVPVFKRFFYNHLCRNSVFLNIIMENGINK
jgi:hypothetical protein